MKESAIKEVGEQKGQEQTKNYPRQIQ